LQEAALRNQHD
jgi:hypothetical protein